MSNWLIDDEPPPPATVERLMELVRTLPPRSMRAERNSYLAEIEAIAAQLRDGDGVPGAGKTVDGGM